MFLKDDSLFYFFFPLFEFLYLVELPVAETGLAVLAQEVVYELVVFLFVSVLRCLYWIAFNDGTHLDSCWEFLDFGGL